ncbi:MAG: radical SAM-associated putative lipoprotein [Bacteroidaceae bacterium]|nr:radical SAM-associated putative lipoprotein [Bacteroidaceae bacterium]
MKAKLVFRTLAAWIMTMLGLSACDSDIFEGEEMYGCPSADYDVTIKVTDEDGNPIKGIKVHRGYEDENAPSLKTDENGIFNSSINAGPSLSYILEDVDGDNNGGTFKSDTLKIQDFKLVQTKKGKGWYEGRFDASAEVTLKKEK